MLILLVLSRCFRLLCELVLGISFSLKFCFLSFFWSLLVNMV